MVKAHEVEAFQPTAQRLLELWSHGLKIHNEEASQRLLALRESIVALDDGQEQDAADDVAPVDVPA